MLAVLISSAAHADEMYSGGVTVDIDREVLGYLWVEDATVNLYANAHIKNYLFYGDVYATSGAVINIYGGQIESILFITTSYTGLPDPVVTIFGTDFAVDGAALEPGTEELFLQNEEVSGVYEDGTPFAYRVDCFWEGDTVMTLKLHWIDAAPAEPEVPDIAVSETELDFGAVELGTYARREFIVSNRGNAPLTIQSVFLVQDEIREFYLTGGEMPVVLDPNEQLEGKLIFAPELVSEVTAVLQIVSDDPNTPRISIPLTAAGVPETLTPAEQIAEILAFVQTSMEDGTLEGAGRGRYSGWNLKSLLHLLKTAQYLIDKDCMHPAGRVLKVVEMKTDGQPGPDDFVEGQAVAELNETVNALRNALEEL